jgi:hypothetical protein
MVACVQQWYSVGTSSSSSYPPSLPPSLRVLTVSIAATPPGAGSPATAAGGGGESPMCVCLLLAVSRVDVRVCVVRREGGRAAM